MVHSIGYFQDALQVAMLHENVSTIKALCLEMFNNKTAKRATVTSSMLTQQSTGTYVVINILPTVCNCKAAGLITMCGLAV